MKRTVGIVEIQKLLTFFFDDFFEFVIEYFLLNVFIQILVIVFLEKRVNPEELMDFQINVIFFNIVLDVFIKGVFLIGRSQILIFNDLELYILVALWILKIGKLK